MKFFEDGLSIDETKMSSLLICLFITISPMVYVCVKREDTQTLLTLALALITAVAGLNVTAMITKNKQDDK
jgi:archaellum biogenesis protein FlaJ (TadC family)